MFAGSIRQLARVLQDSETAHRDGVYHGAPCAQGHTLRRTVNRSCIQCQADNQFARRRAAKASGQ